MEHSFQHFLGHLYLYCLFFNIGFCGCNSLQRTHPKISPSALLGDIDGSLTQDGAHLGKSVYAGARQEIDTAHSPITPSDIKGARDGQHRTHRQAHSENQVSPPLVMARLDTRSLLIGGERTKIASVNRQWHPWDWVRLRSRDRNFEGKDAFLTRKSSLNLFTSAQTEKSGKIAGPNGFMMEGVFSPPHPITSKSKISEINQYRRSKSRSRWNHSTKSVIFNLSGLRNKYSSEGKNYIADGTNISTKRDSPFTISSQTMIPSKSHSLHFTKLSVSSGKNSEPLVDSPNTRRYESEHRKEEEETLTLSLLSDQGHSHLDSPQDYDKNNRSQTTHNSSPRKDVDITNSEGNDDLPRSKSPKQQDGTDDLTGSNPGPSLNAQDSKLTSRARRAATLHVDPRVSQSSRARKEGDAIIGALFPLHYPPTLKTAYSRQCSTIREYYGIQRVEVFLMTIERINR